LAPGIFFGIHASPGVIFFGNKSAEVSSGTRTAPGDSDALFFIYFFSEECYQMKTKVAFFFGAVVLAFLVAACSNPAVEAPQGGTGQILVNIGIEGEESLEQVESLNTAAAGGPLARTVVPAGFSTSSFSKFEANFTATSGGANYGPVVLTGGTNAISLAAGTYTVTITGFTGNDPNFVAAAEGTEAGVVVTQGGSTAATVLVGPKTGAGQGSFSYDITVTPGTASGTLTVTTATGGSVSGGTVSLPGNGTKTDGTIATLDAGYYQALVSVTKGTEYAGFVEIIHIYPGLTSVLPAWNFTDDHFAPAVAVSLFDLTGTFDAPVTGVAPDTSFNAQQYTGAITWSPAVSGNFAASETYTATITLTPKPGYTFDGVTQDAFSYNGTVPTNSAGSGVVEIVFAATGAGNMGTANTSYAVDDGVIAVTVDPSNKTIQKGEAGTLDLTVPGGYTVTGWYIDGTLAGTLGTNLSVSLDPANYSASIHTVSVLATKGGRPYAWMDTFIVEAAGGGGGGTALSLAEFTYTKIQELIPVPNDAATAYTLVLDSSFNLSDTSTLTTMKNAITSAGRYVALDLSDCTATSNTLSGNNTNYPAAPYFNFLSKDTYIIGIKFPSTLTSFGQSVCQDADNLLWVSIPDSVTSIGHRAFKCSNLNSITVGAGLIELNVSSTQALPNSFKAYYFGLSEAQRAGTHVWNGDSWSKE
jgi:hypothetical protein